MAERLESTNPTRTPDVAPPIAAADYQSRGVEAPAAAAVNANATEALVQGRTLPGLTLSDDSASASGRLAMKADGSMDATVRSGDNLWRIAREALGQGHEAGYRASNKDVQAAVAAIARDNHLQNPDLIHPGDVIHIPKELLAKPAQPAERPTQTTPAGQDTTRTQTTPAGQDTTRTQTTPVGQDTTRAQTTPAGQDATAGQAAPTYKMHGEAHNATRAFGNEIMADFEHLPQNVRRLLAESGSRIAVVGKMTDLYPNAGDAGNKQSAHYDADRKALVLAEKHLDPATGTYVRDDNETHTFNFLAGRAVDSALGQMSRSDEFKRAFDADVAAMSPADKARFGALIQGGDNGRAAVFAEVFAGSNGPTNSEDSQAVMRDFANVRRVMQARLAQLPS